MIYTLANTVHVGRRVKRVVDAKGKEYQHTLRVDTETGEITYQKRLPDGTPEIDYEKGSMKTETVTAPAPITVEFD